MKIEQEAYRLLRSQVANENLPDGNTIFNYLVANGFIKNNEDASSAYPDLDLGRQFLSDRQVYHFMASSRYVMQALRKHDNVIDQQQYILRKAIPECINLLYTLTREVIDNPVGANQAGRGIYVLMHAITDSYSIEHTIRDQKTFEIQNIKSWQLSRLFWPKAAKQLDPKSPDQLETMIFLHTNKAEGDELWEDENGNLSPKARQASIALKDLLITIYRAQQDRADVDELITTYIAKHFKPKAATATDDNFDFVGDEKIKLSYEAGYANNSNVMELDRYPLFSHMLFYQNDINQSQRSAYGYELGYHIVPRDAFTPSTLLQRLPYGLLIGIHKNSTSHKNNGFMQSLQIKAAAKVGLYLPLRNLVLEPRLGIGMTPFTDRSINFGWVTGFDLAFNLGRYNDRKRTKRFAIGYEYDTSGFNTRHSLVVKIGFNNWQGRVIKK